MLSLNNFPINEVNDHRSVADILTVTARQFPRAGIKWIADNGSNEIYQPYPSLLAQAARILGGMRALGLLPGDRVLIVLDQPSDFVPVFWAAILGGFIPCPVAPLSDDADRAVEQLTHLDHLLEQPMVVTTKGECIARRWPPGLRVAAIDSLVASPEAKHFHKPGLDDVALLVLTSGSTGNAKAVMLTHANLLASMVGKARRHALGPRDISLNWVSFDHVAALIECHLLPTYIGARQVHVRPATVLSSPRRFLELISNHHVTMTFTPNFLLGQINQALVRGPVGDKVDLTRLNHIISGGEAIVNSTANTFLDRLADFGLRRDALWPAFGMTETCAGSIYSTAFPDIDAGQPFASLGTCITGMKMRIVDEHDVELAEGEVGELQVRGAVVFRGYYNNPSATAEAFTPNGWFRTGDRGSIRLGRLMLAGRSKDSIIVNGVNYYAQDIEAALERLNGVERSFTAAFPMRSPDKDTEELVVVFAPSATATTSNYPAELHRTIIDIRNTVLLHWGFRPALILPLPTSEIPKTSLGKIQRVQLRKRLECGELSDHQAWLSELLRSCAEEFVTPEGDAEIELSHLFADIFQMDAGTISATANFFDLGGTSIDVFTLKVQFEERFGLRSLPLTDILRGPTVRELAQLVTAKEAPSAMTYNPLVPLQRTGTRTPLFCIHPGVGEVLVFVQLAKYFANERPVYALRARGFGDGEVPFENFEEMIDTYTAAVRRAQPSGPYALTGYSYGGVVAFEVAKAIERAGERVAFVGALNVQPEISASRKAIDFVYTAVNLAFLLSLVAEREVPVLTEALRAVSADEVVQRLFETASPRRVIELDLDQPRFARWVEIAFSLVKIARDYEPTGSVSAMTVFYASPPLIYPDLAKSDWLADKLRRWDTFSRAPVDYIDVPGRHQTVMAEHVNEFQAVLRHKLAHALNEINLLKEGDTK